MKLHRKLGTIRHWSDVVASKVRNYKANSIKEQHRKLGTIRQKDRLYTSKVRNYKANESKIRKEIINETRRLMQEGKITEEQVPELIKGLGTEGIQELGREAKAGKEVVAKEANENYKRQEVLSNSSVIPTPVYKRNFEPNRRGVGYAGTGVEPKPQETPSIRATGEPTTKSPEVVPKTTAFVKPMDIDNGNVKLKKNLKTSLKIRRF